MKYQKLQIKNFKGIKDVEIDFSNNRILTLVGLNESGKTTILQAIQTFYDLLNGGTLSTETLKDIRPKGIDFTGDIILTGILEFEADDYSKIDKFLSENGKRIKLKYPKIFSYSFSFKYDLHTYKFLKTTSSFDAISYNAHSNLYKTNNPLWQDIVKYICKTLRPEILYFEDFVFLIPDKITFFYDSKTINNDDKEWRLVFDDILKSVGPKFKSFQENIVSIWVSDNDTARQRLNAMEKKLDKIITNAWKELFDENSEKNSRINFKEIKLIPIVENPMSISFSFKVKTDSGKEFSINERSKGCKWFFSFLIFTEFRKNRTNNILFLLDEPASNLHSSAQLKILQAIESLSDKSVIVYSTHSHHLINPKWLNGAYIVINDGVSDINLEGDFSGNDAKITTERYYDYVSKGRQKLQTIYFQPILDRLDYKQSFLEPVPFIIICEGKYDYITYRYINEVYMSKRLLLNFYPGKGACSNSDIIRLYLSWGGKFLLVLDSDSKGIESQRKYITEFGDILKNKVFTYKDVFNKEMVTENLFSESDVQLFCDNAFGKGTFNDAKSDKKKLKSVFNYAISQHLANNNRIELSKSTGDDFKKLFQFFTSKTSIKETKNSKTHITIGSLNE